MNSKIKLAMKLLIGIFIIWLILFFLYFVLLNLSPQEKEPYSKDEKKLFKELATDLDIESIERYSKGSTEESRNGINYELAINLYNRSDYNGNCFDTIAEYVAKKTNKTIRLGNDYKNYYITIRYYGKMYDGYRSYYLYDIDSISKVNRNHKEK